MLPKLYDGMKLNYNEQNFWPFQKADYSSVRDFASMFRESNYVTDIPAGTTGVIVAEKANRMFYNCFALRVIPDALDFTAVDDSLTATFFNCAALEEVRFVGKITMYINMQYSGSLSEASVLSLAFALEDGAGFSVTLQNSGNINTIIAESVKLNAAGDGLEVCDPADPDSLGTLSQYVTNKGWSIMLI